MQVEEAMEDARPTTAAQVEEAQDEVVAQVAALVEVPHLPDRIAFIMGTSAILVESASIWRSKNGTPDF